MSAGNAVAVHSAHVLWTGFGVLRVWATERGLRRLDFRSGPDLPEDGERLGTGPAPRHLAEAVDALREYLAGRRTDFDLPLDPPPTTPFRRRVHDRLRKVPYGDVTSYGELARALGMPAGGARAVGQAVGANPLAVVVPCHRVLGSDRALHGFGGGLERKAALLRLEGFQVDGTGPESRVHRGRLALEL